MELLDLRYNKLFCLPPSLKTLGFLERIILEDNPPFELPEGLGEKKTQTIVRGSSVQKGKFLVTHADMQGTKMPLAVSYLLEAFHNNSI